MLSTLRRKPTSSLLRLEGLLVFNEKKNFGFSYAEGLPVSYKEELLIFYGDDQKTLWSSIKESYWHSSEKNCYRLLLLYYGKILYSFEKKCRFL